MFHSRICDIQRFCKRCFYHIQSAFPQRRLKIYRREAMDKCKHVMSPLLSQIRNMLHEQMLQGLLCDTDLPHAGLFTVHHGHVVNLVPLNVRSLLLIQLLGHKTHKRVVWSVGCQGQTEQLATRRYKSNFMSEKTRKKTLIKLRWLLLETRSSVHGENTDQRGGRGKSCDAEFITSSHYPTIKPNSI